METKIQDCKEFLQRYWNYFLILEKDFLATERYLAIDTLNFKAYSNEYIKLYQTVCSEIDVIAKSYCGALGTKAKNINEYCQCITINNTDFTNRTVRLGEKSIDLQPWKNWLFTTEIQSDGKTKVSFISPDWWTKYNKVKHSRTTKNQETGLPYYKLANQENVLNSLAALYQLEIYYYRYLHTQTSPNEPDVPYPPSQIFHIKDWQSHSVVIGSNIWFDTH